jgi:uncharacterized protein YjbI with pentapeptide repeats
MPLKEELVAKLREGTEVWNRWIGTLSNEQREQVDLTGADLDGCNLSGVDLSRVNLSKASLRGSSLEGASFLRANLSECNLSNSDLRGAVVDGVNLEKASLVSANLRGAALRQTKLTDACLVSSDLREVNLRGCDISNLNGGLLPWQLAGAVLTAAKLPPAFEKLYDKLGSVAEISDSAKKLFLGLLAGCLYCWLTIGMTKDVDLITNRSSSPLPIIQAVIPIVGFYVAAPLILLCVYFYFHFYLQKLWEELATFPAVFSDGKPLYQRADPWLFNDLVRAHFSMLRPDRPFLSYFQQWLSVVLAWWLVPLTLVLFWGRYLPRHDRLWTYFHAVIFAVAVVAAWRLHRLARKTLRGEERLSFKQSVRRPGPYLGILAALIVMAAAITISRAAILGSPESPVPRVLTLLGYSPFADLFQADVSLKPVDWTGRSDSELDRVKGANLGLRDLRHAMAWGAFLAKARLQGSDLQNAFLFMANLQGAELSVANLHDANLYGANLKGASLYDANLQKANLKEAKLNGAVLNLADLRDAFLVEADLSRANLPNADLRNAILNRANLTEAILTGADLTKASLCSLSGECVELKYADMRYTHGLDPKMIQACKDWRMAFFDDEMLKKLGLPKDHNEKLEEQRKLEEHR